VLNEIGVCDVATGAPVALDSFGEIRSAECFILMVARGMIGSDKGD